MATIISITDIISIATFTKALYGVCGPAPLSPAPVSPALVATPPKKQTNYGTPPTPLPMLRVLPSDPEVSSAESVVPQKILTSNDIISDMYARGPNLNKTLIFCHMYERRMYVVLCVHCMNAK
jgi:hypothetical protein